MARNDAAGSPAPSVEGAATPASLSDSGVEAEAEAAAVETPAPHGAWRMGLVVTASALCGGIAVVLWNRRLLTKMREVAPVERRDFQDRQGRLWEDDI